MKDESRRLASHPPEIAGDANIIPAIVKFKNLFIICSLLLVTTILLFTNYANVKFVFKSQQRKCVGRVFETH
jgi:hypothetical protein